MNRIEKVVKNTVARFLSQGLGIGLSAIFLMYITRKLGSADFGKYMLAFSLAGSLVVISEIGISAHFTKEVSLKKTNAPLVFGNVLIIRSILSVLFFLVLILAYYLFGYSESIYYLVIAMGIFCLTTSFFDIPNSVFRGFECMEYESIFMLINRIVITISGITILFLGYGLNGFIISIVLSNILTLIPTIIVSFNKFICPKIKLDIKIAKSIIKDSLPIGIMLLLTTLSIKAGMLILPLFKNYIDVGIYGAPQRLLESLIVFPVFFSAALLPTFTSFYYTKFELLSKCYEGSCKFLLVSMLPFVVIVTVFATSFVRFLFGKNFLASAIVLQLLIWGTVFISLNTLSSYLFIATNKQKINIITYGTATISTIILSLILIPHFSYIGAGIALLAGQVLLFLIATYFIFKTLFNFLLIKLFVYPIMSSFVMWGIIYYLGKWNIFLSILIGLIFYTILLFVLRVITKEDIILMKGILHV